jgi:hypothetical protein
MRGAELDWHRCGDRQVQPVGYEIGMVALDCEQFGMTLVRNSA